MPQYQSPLWWNILVVFGCTITGLGVLSVLYVMLPKMNLLAILNVTLFRPAYLVSLKITRQSEQVYRHHGNPVGAV